MNLRIAIFLVERLRKKDGGKILMVCLGIVFAFLLLFQTVVCLVVSIGTAAGTLVSTFLVDDTRVVAEVVQQMDETRRSYVDEQMASYRASMDPLGKSYRNVVLQYENGFSNNDKEILTAVSIYYEQDWNTDMSALAKWMVLNSIEFETQIYGPYSCGGCESRKICDGHVDQEAPGVWYYHDDGDGGCDNYHTETYCPGNHYDLYVTATLVGCRNWTGEAGATVETIAQWGALSDQTPIEGSRVAAAVLSELHTATLNEDWEGWSDINIEWAEQLYMTDWSELYGVTVSQIGVTDTGHYEADQFEGNGSFIIPLERYSYISCHFGDPDGVDGSRHKGMDFAAGYGTSILAAGDGIVVTAGYHFSWGNYVKIYNGEIDGHSIYTLYAHCSSLGVTAGQTVTQGQVIAAVGSTGQSTGNHLHFEVYVDNTRVDPEGWL